MKFRALLFDLDGTLIDSLPDLTAAVNATRSELGLSPISGAAVRSYVGDGVYTLLRRGIPERVAEEIFPRFKVHYDANLVVRTRPYPGVPETLQRLRDAGCRMAVVTNKLQSGADGVLGGLGLRPYFDLVIGGDSPHGLKPAAGPFLHALRVLGVEASETLMVGDGKPDALGARGMGLPFCAILFGIGEPAMLQAFHPEYQIERFSQLGDLVLGGAGG